LHRLWISDANFYTNRGFAFLYSLGLMALGIFHGPIIIVDQNFALFLVSRAGLDRRHRPLRLRLLHLMAAVERNSSELDVYLFLLSIIAKQLPLMTFEKKKHITIRLSAHSFASESYRPNEAVDQCDDH
jgi:hypothetical protein